MLLRAEQFPSAFTHGFTTRKGGVSQGRHATLNLGSRWGDDPEAVAENLRRVADAGGFAPEQLARVKQVHGDAVLAVHELDKASEADALWIHRDHPGAVGVVIGVMTADCVPILLCDRQGSMAAAIHSGWRGTVADIAARAVETLRGAGADPGDLFAAIGPCIEVDAFEVGEEVAAQFDERFVARAGFAKPHVDLVARVRAQLEGVGIPANQIERVGGCTHANPDLYFSFRRDGAGIGQHLSFIGMAS